MKRLFDLLISIVGIILVLPVLFITAILIRKKMPNGPVIFRQKRVGKDGKLFTIFKFRTMEEGHGGSSISVKGEQRITPLGAILRKYKIDELPELWNVIKGDMSIVGPRPDVPGFADKLSGEFRNILKLKPGITGPATIKYANEEEMLSGVENPEEYNNIIYLDKTKINLDYFYRHSVWGDLRIILSTIFKMFN